MVLVASVLFALILVGAILFALDVVILFAIESFSSSLYDLYDAMPNNWFNVNKNTTATNIKAKNPNFREECCLSVIRLALMASVKMAGVWWQAAAHHVADVFSS